MPRFVAALLALLAITAAPATARAAFPGENGLITFLSDRRDGQTDVYAVTADGTSVGPLTASASAELYPVYDPRGINIAFASAREGDFKIFKLSVSLQTPVRLTNPPAGDQDIEPGWGQSGRLVWVRAHGSDPPQLWTMDTTHLELGEHQLTNTSGGYNVDPMFSPDGTQIAFTSNRDGDEDIYVMNADGTNVRQVTNVAGQDFGPTWSPDGNQVAFASTRDGNAEIYRINADGTGPQTNLTHNSTTDTSPAWSPDGSRIAFTSDRDGDFDILTMNAGDGQDVQVIANAIGSDTTPDWRPLPSTPTPAGTAVNVSPSDPAIVTPLARITFAHVTGAGVTTVEQPWGWADPPPPSGFGTIPSSVYEIHTTATFDSAELCFADPGPNVSIGHYVNGTWTLLTLRLQVEPSGAHLVCATVTSLSPFAFLEPVAGDTQAPVLSLPANITVDATKPSGAVVSFTMGATDNADPAPAVTCTPSAGAIFAIAVTTVHCSATDQSGNVANGTFTVTVRGATEQLSRLIADVVGSTSLSPALKTQLTTTLQSLVAKLDTTKPVQKLATCVALDVFATAVKVLSGHGITAARAADWVASAHRIKDVIGC